MMKKKLCSSSTIHLIIKKFQTRLTKDIKGRGGVQVIIWYIKDKYLPSKSSKLAQTTWHSLHTMKNRVKWKKIRVKRMKNRVKWKKIRVKWKKIRAKLIKIEVKCFKQKTW